MNKTSTVEVEFGEREMAHVLYNLEHDGPGHRYTTEAQMHQDSIQAEEARVSVSINIDPDESEFSEETIREGEELIAACLHSELELVYAERDDDGLLP